MLGTNSGASVTNWHPRCDRPWPFLLSLSPRLWARLAPAGGWHRLWEVRKRMTASDLWAHSDGVKQQQPSVKFRATLPSNLIPGCGVHTVEPPESSELRPLEGITLWQRLKLTHACPPPLAGLPEVQDARGHWGHWGPADKSEPQQSCLQTHQQCWPLDPCTTQQKPHQGFLFSSPISRGQESSILHCHFQLDKGKGPLNRRGLKPMAQGQCAYKEDTCSWVSPETQWGPGHPNA